MSADYVDPIAAETATYEEYYRDADDGVQLRVLHWRPKRDTGNAPLVFIPGWVSVVNGWADLLRAIVARREVIYIETREKGSAKIARAKLTTGDFTIQRLAQDLRTVIGGLPLELNSCIFSGSSLGATTVIEAMKDGRFIPKAAFFIGPTCEFYVPWFGNLVIAMPAASYHVLKYWVLWYLRTFRVDVEKEPEQMARYDATLKSAHPVRIKRSAKAFSGFKIWDGLEAIPCPTGLAYASSDKLHGADSIRRLAEALPQGEVIPAESNKYLHSAAVAADLEAFIGRLGED